MSTEQSTPTRRPLPPTSHSFAGMDLLSPRTPRWTESPYSTSARQMVSSSAEPSVPWSELRVPRALNGSYHNEQERQGGKGWSNASTVPSRISLGMVL
eukprot:752167-Hanusia_phi.AAC.5